MLLFKSHYFYNVIRVKYFSYLWKNWKYSQFTAFTRSANWVNYFRTIKFTWNRVFAMASTQIRATKNKHISCIRFIRRFNRIRSPFCIGFFSDWENGNQILAVGSCRTLFWLKTATIIFIYTNKLLFSGYFRLFPRFLEAPPTLFSRYICNLKDEIRKTICSSWKRKKTVLVSLFSLHKKQPLIDLETTTKKVKLICLKQIRHFEEDFCALVTNVLFCVVC